MNKATIVSCLATVISYIANGKALTSEDIGKLESVLEYMRCPLSKADMGAGAGTSTGTSMVAGAMSSRARDERSVYNARLLMQQYRSLKTYCREAVTDKTRFLAEADDGMLTLMLDSISEEFILNSVLHSAVRTQMLLGHVDRMLERYRANCMCSADRRERRHWEVIEALYISDEPLTQAQLAEKMDCDARTVQRYQKAGLITLSTLFFGADGLRLSPAGMETALPESGLPA